jgi:protocatechuate 3,4-dioxygenase beta subunit
MNLNATTRRRFLQSAAASGVLFTTPGLFAEKLLRTAAVGEGPFYPDKLPLDTDNDLLLLNDSITPAVGDITHLTGRILAPNGDPVRNAFVEIWQCDSNGVYIHSGSSNKGGQDKNFQGYGRFLTDVKGNYYFRTIRPVAYPGRTPHIHVAVSVNGKRLFTTQMLDKANKKQNERDGLFRQIRDPKARETILAEFKPIKGSKIKEFAANFDVVLGRTIQENEDGSISGGIGKPQYRRRRG